jgi:hypothetical protein
MRKIPVSRRRHSRAAADAGPVPTSGVTIASGAHVPRIDFEALFSNPPAAETAATPLTGVAMTGGGVQTAAAVSHDGGAAAPITVALPDGTRITFATADWLRPLEPA